MASLTELYSQPHKLVLQLITEVLTEPAVKIGDSRGFHLFTLKVPGWNVGSTRERREN